LTRWPEKAAAAQALLEAEKQRKGLLRIAGFADVFARCLSVGYWRQRNGDLSAPCARGDRENWR
jgi:hypothetical protein